MMARDSFRSRRGFIIACIGSAVGMGNIWLFPARVSEFGGAAFLIPYFICVIVIGFTGVVGEMAFGRAMGAGPMGAFGAATEKAGKGRTPGELLSLIPVLGSLALAIGYSVVVGWILKYLVGSLSGNLFEISGVEGYADTFNQTAASFGNIGWHLTALAITFAIMVYGIASGIEKANKVMMPLFFVMFVGMAVYIATLPGASQGYRYLTDPDWSLLASGKTWIYALGQAFFSLSLAGSGTLVYGSYLKRDVDIPYSARTVALWDTIAALAAAVTIIPAMATAGQSLSGGGPGLMFIYLPNVFAQMPGGRVVMTVFFIAVAFAGLTSLVNLFETPVEALQTKLGLSRKKAVATVAAVGTVAALCIEGIVSDWMDVCSIYLCPIGALIAGVMFFWICGKEFVRQEIDSGAVRKLVGWYESAGKYVFCGLTVIVLVLGSIMGGIG
ncbi:MAG: sodium-dependent transporter [Firmicutes bacterium]|nr:sodium-dependent transporter [Bacillota bacterium]